MNSNVIAYTVGKSNNSNLYISVQNGEVLVKAPWYFTKSRIQEAVEEKRTWILEKIKEYNLNKKEKLSLKPIKVFGVEYNLKVVYKDIQIIECNIYKNIVEINLPKKCKKLDNETMTNILIDKMYKKIAERELDSIMEKMRVNLKVVPEDYEIKEMNNCLAKITDDRKIIINPIIVKYEKEVIEYVILHEYCHLLYKRHTRGFYELIKKHCKDYELIERKLDGINY